MKRQEKELTLYYEDIENDDDDEINGQKENKEIIEEPKPKNIYSDHLFSEETLALAIIGTAFVALLLGFFLGMFVTRTCSPKDGPKSVQSSKSSSSSLTEEIHKYSVTTISSHCDQKSTDNEFNSSMQISVENESQFKSLPPQFSVTNQSSQQPMSLNPTNLDRQR